MDIRVILLLSVGMLVPLCRGSPADYFWDESVEERGVGTVKERVDLRVYNPTFRVTKERTLEILAEADLESNGFTKKVVFGETLSSSGEVMSPFEKMYYYFKSVPCSESAEVAGELDALLEGALGPDVVAKFGQDMKTKMLDNEGMCEVGAEFHFKNKRDSQVKRSRRASGSNAAICIGVCLRAQQVK